MASTMTAARRVSFFTIGNLVHANRERYRWLEAVPRRCCSLIAHDYFRRIVGKLITENCWWRSHSGLLIH